MLITGEMFSRQFYLIGVLWFLKSLFMCAITYYTATMFRHRNVAIIISLVLSQGINLVYFSWMYPCFLFGVLLREWLPWCRVHRWQCF